MALLDQLTADVAAQTTVDASIEQLLDNVVAQLKVLQASSPVDPAALKALTDQIEANNAAIVAKVTANTPAPAAKSA